MWGYYHLSTHVIVESLNNPKNRHETRVRHDCSDEELYLRPDWLVQNWMETHPNEMDKIRDEPWRKV
jgi:hypothetical protein